MAYKTGIPHEDNDWNLDLEDMRENFDLLEDAQIVEHNLDVSDPSNGYYVRWENGLQVCWDKIELEYKNDDRMELNDVDFPASFSGIGSLNASTYKEASDTNPNYTELEGFLSIDVKYTRIKRIGYNDSSVTFSDGDLFGVTYIVIGRWK